MKKTRRTAQVGETIRMALVESFRELKGVDLGMVSITGVEVSPDLHYARVFISGLTEEATRESVKTLNDRRGKLRGALGAKIHLRYTPELEFRYDETSMRAGRIEDLLHEIRVKDAARAAEDVADEDVEADDEDDA